MLSNFLIIYIESTIILCYNYKIINKATYFEGAIHEEEEEEEICLFNIVCSYTNSAI